MNLLGSILFLIFSTSLQTDFALQLSDAAIELTHQEVSYDPSYYSISYPGGDIPPGLGVCTDVVIRAYRSLGIDLQIEVHEDMTANFEDYPNRWGLRTCDTNIDHRRVPNLMKFFERHGTMKPISTNPEDFAPGDIVCWNLGGGITHIGIIVNRTNQTNNRHLVAHNIGGGQVLADCLFEYEIIGHYTYTK